MDSLKSNGTDTTAISIPSNGHSRMLSDEVSGSPPTASGPAQEKTSIKGCLRENVLTFATLLGVVLGIALGIGLKGSRTWTTREVMYINFPGELFLNMLKCLILPLIFSSLVSAIGNMDTKLTGKIGYRAILYYMSTTVLAIILGIILVISIKPGKYGNGDDVKEQTETMRRETLPEDTLMDLVRNMFPPNIMQASLKSFSTVIKRPKMLNETENITTEEKRQWKYEGKMESPTNILGIVVFSVVLGIAIAKLKKKGKPILDVITAFSEAIMLITKWVIWLSPVGVMFLVASKMLLMDNAAMMAGQVGMYSLTVLLGVHIHGFVILPIIYFVIVRKNPLTFIFNMGQALATAFGTASSAATLPVTINCLEEKNKVDPRVSRFCLPIGATINMDGTALYEAVAAIFIAQVRGVSLGIGNIIAMSITATAASVGAAGIPQAGLVTMVMVLNVLGLPAEDVSLILLVDWLLDRFRTTINVLGDAFGGSIVGHLSENDLAELDKMEELNLEMTTL